MNFFKHFRETMDVLGVSGKELAEATGRSQKNISQIRYGKSGVSVSDFEDLIMVCDRLKPGFRREFKRRCMQDPQPDIEDLIEDLDTDGVAAALFLLSNRLAKLRQGKIPVITR